MLPKTTIALAVAFPAISAAAPTINKRIIGGTDAEIGDFTSMVSIQMGNDLCGGTLLSKYTVLIAAHCLGAANNDTVAKAGVADNKKDGEYSSIREIKVHPDFNTYGHYTLDDIALVYLKEGFDEGETIAYANLAVNGSDPEVGSEHIALGWGTQNYEKFKDRPDPTDKLSKVGLEIYPRGHCWSRLLGAGKTGAETIVCAGGRGKNVCKHDDGGPLIDQKKRVVGIASLVIKDRGGSYCNLEPSVFTRVGSYSDWINENLVTEPPTSTEEQTDFSFEFPKLINGDVEAKPPASTEDDVYVEFPSPTKPVPTSVPTVSNFPPNLNIVVTDVCDRRGLGSDNSCPPVVKYCIFKFKEDGYSSTNACVGAFEKAGLMTATKNKEAGLTPGTENQGTENQGTANKGTENQMCSST
ncbi:Mite allergen Eur m 3 [Metarhizium brunneum]|uniref:Mite allergen Eur m 3 n=1 Tax=Metarhizium brunneum TaxID=500148 RepID=A0A7D5YU63_9HYPO